MPVFFYIDPDFDDDPAMAKVDTITLSYTFFESKDGDSLLQPLRAATYFWILSMRNTFSANARTTPIFSETTPTPIDTNYRW